MADIELVIKLPEKMYHMINAGFYDYGDMNVIIRNGTPLPKGHGRLIDADAVEKEMNKDEVEADRNADYYTSDKIDCAMEYLIDALTIIEADKDGE